jgi:hypothetical protein
MQSHLLLKCKAACPVCGLGQVYNHHRSFLDENPAVKRRVYGVQSLWLLLGVCIGLDCYIVLEIYSLIIIYYFKSTVSSV